MKPPPTGKTIIKFKIRGTRRTRDFYLMFKILLVPVLLLAVFGGLQVAVCKNAHPKRDWTQCLRPTYPQEKK